MIKEDIQDCPDCAVKPGQVHSKHCDVQRCSVCGTQYLSCDCEGHDPLFARWTGFWPGAVEAYMLEIDLNQFYEFGYYEHFFIKPTPS